MKRISIVASVTLLLACLAGVASAEDGLSGTALEVLGDDIPEPPAGFDTAQEAMQAVLTGKVAPINADLPTPDGIRVTKDVEFGTGGERPLTLDLYQPEESSEPTPGLIFIHGGGWGSGTKDVYRYYGIKFAEKGYVVASISYRLSGEATFPAAVEDCKCAVRWMRTSAVDLGVDPDRIAVAGGSAGGHLAMMVGYTADVEDLEGDGGHDGVSSSVQCVVNIYGPADLTTDFVRTNAGANRMVSQFLGASIDDDLPLYQHASPLTHLDKSDPPTLILHGTTDDIVLIRQADMLAEKLKDVEVPYIYDRLAGWPHAMDIAQPVNDRCVWLMERFFAAMLANDKQD